MMARRWGWAVAAGGVLALVGLHRAHEESAPLYSASRAQADTMRAYSPLASAQEPSIQETNASTIEGLANESGRKLRAIVRYVVRLELVLGIASAVVSWLTLMLIGAYVGRTERSAQKIPPHRVALTQDSRSRNAGGAFPFAVPARDHDSPRAHSTSMQSPYE
jgi:hypothetical protein